MTERPIRVLLVDGQVEDSRWVQDLLLDFSENRYGGSRWMAGIDVFHLQRLEDSLLLLSDPAEPIDAVLLNPALPDSFGLPSLLKLQSAAPHVPVLILSDLDDADLALSMVRAGAQEFLVKAELDCVPLARALRLAIERQRTNSELRALSWRDAATGLYNRHGFDTLCGQTVAAARALGCATAILSVEAMGLREIGRSYGREESELALLEAAEGIRRHVPPHGFAAHLGLGHFLVVYATGNPSDPPRLAGQIRRHFLKWTSGAARQALRFRFTTHVQAPEGETTAQDLLRMLCENDGVERIPEPETKPDPLFAAANSARCDL